MNSTKYFIVLVSNCKSRQQANQIARSLRMSFPHSAEYITDKNLSLIVKAYSIHSVRSVIEPALKNAHAVLGSFPAWLENEKLSSGPPRHVRFKLPTRPRRSVIDRQSPLERKTHWETFHPVAR
jgi:hypothetical protein